MGRLALILLLPGLLAAQAPPAAFDPGGDPALIEKGLQSSLPLQVAISAFRSIKNTDHRRGEWLRNALARSSSLQPEADALRARRAIFDALIKTGTAIPLVELLPFFDQFPAAVIAVVARGDPTAAEDLLPLLVKAEEAKNSTYWYAVASLMNWRDLVPHLVRQARFDYAISVQDLDLVQFLVFEYPHFWSRGGILGGVVSGLPNSSRVTWPEETVYQIEMSGDEDQVLTCCIGGSTYLKAWSSNVRAASDRRDADPSVWQDHDREVVRILLSKAHCKMCSLDRGDFPNVRGGKATVVWHSAEQARTLLNEAIEQYVNECVRMVAELGVAISEAQLRPKIRIWIRDWRRVTTIPIPTVGGGVEVNLCAPTQKASTNARCFN